MILAAVLAIAGLAMLILSWSIGSPMAMHDGTVWWQLALDALGIISISIAIVMLSKS